MKLWGRFVVIRRDEHEKNNEKSLGNVCVCQCVGCRKYVLLQKVTCPRKWDISGDIFHDMPICESLGILNNKPVSWNYTKMFKRALEIMGKSWDCTKMCARENDEKCNQRGEVYARVSSLCIYVCMVVYTFVRISSLLLPVPRNCPPNVCTASFYLHRDCWLNPRLRLSVTCIMICSERKCVHLCRMSVYTISEERQREERTKESACNILVCMLQPAGVTTSGLRPNTLVIQVMQCWFQYAVLAVRLPAFASSVSVRLFWAYAYFLLVL